MNKALTNEIVRHIFVNLGIIKSDIFDEKSSKSLLDKEYKLSYNLTLIGEDGKEVKNKVWGCKSSADQRELTMLIGNLTTDGIPAFVLFVQLKDAPAYCVYYAMYDGDEDESMIACTINQLNWMECNVHLQATFLAAMEQIRDIGLSWRKAEECEDQYKMMLSFIKYHESLNGELDEGQEN